MEAISKVYDYSEYLTAEDFYYYWLDLGTKSFEPLRTELMYPAVLNSATDYDVSFMGLRWGDFPELADKPAYIMVGPLDPRQLSFSQLHYLGELVRTGCIVNIISAYPLTETLEVDDIYAETKILIKRLDQRYGFNHIYPDAVINNFLTVSVLDINSNNVCESFRSKVQQTRDDSPEARTKLRIVRLREQAAMAEFALLYRKYGLYDRATTDGMLAARTEFGIMMTQTRTSKTLLTADDCGLLLELDSENNALKYVGEKLLSSDAEIAVALAASSKKYAIHFHYPDKDLSRGVSHPQLTTHEEIPYGELASAERIIAAMQEIGLNIVLRNHGVVCFVDSPAEFEQVLVEVFHLTQL